AEVPEIITGVQDAVYAAAPHCFAQHITLVQPVRPDLQHHLPRLDPQMMAIREVTDWLAERGRRGRRVGRPAGVNGHGTALVLEPRTLRDARLLQQPAQFLANSGDVLAGRDGLYLPGDRVPPFESVM